MKNLLFFLLPLLLANCSPNLDKNYVDSLFKDIYSENKRSFKITTALPPIKLEIQKKINITLSTKMGIKDFSLDKTRTHYNGKNHKSIYGTITLKGKKGDKKRGFIVKLLTSGKRETNGYQERLYDLILTKTKSLKSIINIIKFSELSTRTKKIVASIKQKTFIIVFGKQKNSLRDMLLKEIASYNPNMITLAYIDAKIERGTAANYGIGKNGYILIRSGAKDYLLDERKFSSLKNMDKFYTGENLIALALKRVCLRNDNMFNITGHLERNRKNKSPLGTSAFFNRIENAGFTVSDSRILSSIKSNESSTMIIIHPRRNFSSYELKKINRFTKAGGNIFLLLDKPIHNSYKQFLKQYKIVAHSGTVVDPIHRDFIRGPAYVNCFAVQNNKLGKITINTNNKLLIVRATAFSVTTKSSNVIPFLVTSTNSWVEKNYDDNKAEDIEINRRDEKKGSYAIGLKIATKSKGSIFVFGDSDFISNKILSTKLANWHLFISLINKTLMPTFFPLQGKKYNKELINTLKL